MARPKKIPIEKADDIGVPTCKNCKHQVTEIFQGQIVGFCYRYPPVIIMDSDGDPFMMRPEADDNDLACGEFQPMN